MLMHVNGSAVHLVFRHSLAGGTYRNVYYTIGAIGLAVLCSTGGCPTLGRGEELILVIPTGNTDGNFCILNQVRAFANNLLCSKFAVVWFTDQNRLPSHFYRVVKVRVAINGRPVTRRIHCLQFFLEVEVVTFSDIGHF